MRFPNQRLAQLFTLLRNETLPQDELAQRLSVSTRTVRADITALNTLLAQYGAQFILNRGSGYQLKIDNPTSFQALEETAPKAQHVPRTAGDRITFLLVRFLTSAFSIKLEDLADEWFVSRATLQNDMVEVRERFQRYQLTLETRPRHGMKLFGSEVSIRACLTDLLWELTQQGDIAPPIGAEAFAAEVPALLEPVLQETLTRHHIRLTDAGERFVCLYGAVVVRRVSEGYPLADFSAEDVAQNVRDAARELTGELQRLAGKPLSPAEEEWLCVHIAARQVQDVDPETISADDDEALVNYILRYINSQYNYNLLDDAQLHADLLTHIKTMITRVRYQIMIPNPLLDNIKQHYPMARDMTTAAVSVEIYSVHHQRKRNRLSGTAYRRWAGAPLQHRLPASAAGAAGVRYQQCDGTDDRGDPAAQISAAGDRRYHLPARVRTAGRDRGGFRYLNGADRRKRQAGGDHRAVPHRLSAGSNRQAGAGGPYPSVDAE